MKYNFIKSSFDHFKRFFVNENVQIRNENKLVYFGKKIIYSGGKIRFIVNKKKSHQIIQFIKQQLMRRLSMGQQRHMVQCMEMRRP